MSEKPTVEEYLQNIQDGQFKAYKCVDCGMVIAPPSGSCYGCGSSKMEWTNVSGKGKIVSFTVIHIAPDAFAEETAFVQPGRPCLLRGTRRRCRRRHHRDADP